jgi:hypothetical protein
MNYKTFIKTFWIMFHQYPLTACIRLKPTNIFSDSSMIKLFQIIFSPFLSIIIQMIGIDEILKKR